MKPNSIIFNRIAKIELNYCTNINLNKHKRSVLCELVKHAEITERETDKKKLKIQLGRLKLDLSRLINYKMLKNNKLNRISTSCC